MPTRRRAPCASGSWPRGCARCPRRWRRCSSAPRWPATERRPARRRLRRRAARRDLHPGRHQPLQRLLRRAPRRRHRGPPRARARDRRRPRPAAPGARRDLRVASGWRCLCGVYLVCARRPDPARHRRRVDPRRRALHRRPAALRLRGPRRGLRLPVLRRRRRDRLLLRAGRAADVGGLRARGPGRPARVRDPRRQQRPRPGDRPARRQAHAGRATRARARAYPVRTHGLRRLPDRAGALGGGVAVGMAAAAPGARCRWPSRSCASCAAHADGPTLNLRAGAGPGCSSSRSACCCRRGCCSS